MTMPPAMHQYCHHGEPNCISAWLHTGPCRPGCRICGTADHLTPDCPSWNPAQEMTMSDHKPIPSIGGPTPIAPEPSEAARAGRAAARRVLRESGALQEWETELLENHDPNAPVRGTTADQNIAEGDDAN